MSPIDILTFLIVQKQTCKGKVLCHQSMLMHILFSSLVEGEPNYSTTL